MKISEFFERLEKTVLLRRFFKNGTLMQFVKYGISGCTSFVVEYSVFVGLTLLFPRISILIPNSIAMFTSFWVSFLLNKFWSFKSQGQFMKQLTKFVMLFFINLGVSSLMLYLMVSVGGMNKFIAKLITIGVIVCWNFIIYKKVIYK